ncbi:MAG: rane-associated zinc metalloprotease [Verrucomicrobia bacterium]|nr:rane-associated zinc metalloprotease [Verrucomicrobiota bacterium]
MSFESLPSVFGNIWSGVLVVLFFGASIFVHELGHFLAARWRGVKVERFSIGFGPPIFSWTGRDGVEYRLAWIPLGGYVLLPQLADLGPVEGASQVDVDSLPPIRYPSKMIVFAAGAAFNVLFAFALACIVWVAGQPTFSELNTTQIGNIAPTLKLTDGSVVPNPAMEAGLHAGDVVKSIDGTTVNNFEDIITNIFLGRDRAGDGRRKSLFVIARGEQTLELTVYPRLVGDENVRSAGIEPSQDLSVDSVVPGSPAELAGVKPGDRILAVDGTTLFQRVSVSEYLAKNASRAVEFTLRRGDRDLKLPIQPRLELDEGSNKQVARVGIRYRDSIVIIHPSPFSQIADNVSGTFRTLGALLSPSSDIGPSKLTGPIGIARELHRQAQWDFRRLLWFTILINVNLAIFNLLPIPVLDGGQMVFATVARLRGRPLPVNLVITAQSVFMVLLLSMIIYVSCFDVARLRRENRVDLPRVGPVPAASKP